MNGTPYIHTIKYYSAMKKQVLIYAATWMNLENIMLGEKKPAQKPHIVWYYLYGICPEWANPYKQKVDKWLSGTERGESEVTSNRYEVSFWSDEKFWNWIVVMFKQVY